MIPNNVLSHYSDKSFVSHRWRAYLGVSSIAIMFDITSDMKKRIEVEKLSMQKKAQSALTQNQFEVCDKIITLAADTASAQTDDLIRMIGQLGAALGIQTSEKDAVDMLCDATVSIGNKMLVSAPDVVVLSPNELRKTQVETIGWAIVANMVGR